MADLSLLQASIAQKTATVTAGHDRGSKSPEDLTYFEHLDAQVTQTQAERQDPTQEQPRAEPSEDVAAPPPPTTSSAQ